MQARQRLLVVIPGILFTGLIVCTQAAERAPSPGEQRLSEAAAQDRYSYVLFYRQADSATKAMQQAVQAHVAEHQNKTSLVTVQLQDLEESALVARFDATRSPMPTVVGIAPNGAVTGIYPRAVSRDQLQRSILTPGHSDMVKALQDQKIVIVCLQPASGGSLPRAVEELEASAEFAGRLHRVTAEADDSGESPFFARMRVRTDISSPMVLLFAPPGVHLGTFDASVTGAVLAQKLHASGKCNCSKCQHHR